MICYALQFQEYMFLKLAKSINNMNSKQYDYQDDHSSEQVQQKEQLTDRQKELQRLDDDYNVAKLNADLNEISIQTKTNDNSIRRLQKDIQTRVTQSLLTQTIALINSGIQTDPNIIKLLKTREGNLVDEQNDKIKMNALSLSRKLNQISQSLSILLSGIKKLEGRITTVQADLNSQLNQKHNSHQILIQEMRSEQIKESMDLQQRMEQMTSQLTEKQREMDTKVNWKLNEFKSKIDDKISQELMLTFLETTEKRIDKNMKQYQLKSNINPDRIDKIQQDIQNNRLIAENGLTECQYTLTMVKKDIDSVLLKKDIFQVDKAKIQKRLDLFNTNFNDVYSRVKKCQSQQKIMDESIKKLLTDTNFSISELKRINTILINLRISQDFQRMLQEMNPTKVLELQDTVQQVKVEQINIFKQIQLAKRQIDKVNSKADIMGVMMPNKARDKLKKQELQEALSSFFTDHHFAQKIANIDRQLNDYKISIQAINLLNKQVARIQKESDFHKLASEIRMLEENVKKEFLFLHKSLKQKNHYQEFPFEPADRPVSKGISSNSGDPMPLGQAFNRRSFSVKKVNSIASINNSIMGNTIKHINELKYNKKN